MCAEKVTDKNSARITKKYSWRTYIAVLFSVLLVGFLIRWALFLLPMDTIKVATDYSKYETPPSNIGLEWTKSQEGEVLSTTPVFQWASEELWGACYPTDPTKENVDCAMEQNGLRVLGHQRYPERNIFYPAGLNFEHILSGLAVDENRNWFTPRREHSYLTNVSDKAVSLFWPADASAWNASAEMIYALGNGPYVDMTFKTAFEQPIDRAYIVYMWASYLRETRRHCIHYFGARDVYELSPGTFKGMVQWVHFGEREIAPETPENSIVPYMGMPALKRESVSSALNIDSVNRCAFLLPFFYGLVDGDGDLATTNDDMLYMMMFDQAAPIRFIMWDFSKNEHRPVWDWQYVIHHPKPFQSYQYRARLVYKPFLSVEDAVQEYVSWLKGLADPRHELSIAVDPPGSGVIYPNNLDGMYGDQVRVYFGVNPAQGWKFDRWEGPVDDSLLCYTGIQLNQSSRVRALCKKQFVSGCK